MSQEENFINGELLRLRREERGWVLSDMALRSCMSVKQIRQLEEGGTSAFYSEAVKFTAAKKAAAVLGLSEREVFENAAEALPPPASEPVSALPEVDLAPISATVDEMVVAVAPPVVPVSSSASAVTEASEPKSKTSLWTIVGLFVIALAVAAYLQPQEEETVEAAPPLQVVPEAETAASGTEPVASSASAAAEVAASASQKSMAAALPAASGAVSAVVPVRVSASAASSVPVSASAASRAP